MKNLEGGHICPPPPPAQIGLTCDPYHHRGPIFNFNSITSVLASISWMTCLSATCELPVRRLLCIRMPYSASEMFVSCGIPSFYELLRKCIFDLSERIGRNTNSIIEACLSPKVYIFSPIRQWWRSVLF